MDNVEAFLQHYGKKGMRWGVRRSKSNSAVTTGQHKQMKKKRKEVSAKHPSAKSLSDADLKAAVNRMNMEKQYNQLIGAKGPKSQAASKFIKGVAGTAVKGAVTGLATQQVGAALKKATKTG